jgi:hypothetical protein
MAPSDAESPASPDESQEEGVRCDFCNEVVPTVRRVALDRDYERLRTPHKELFACPACSERKEKERLGLEHRSR